MKPGGNHHNLCKKRVSLFPESAEYLPMRWQSGMVREDLAPLRGEPGGIG